MSTAAVDRVGGLRIATAVLFVASALGAVLVSRADDDAVDLAALAAATREAGSGRMAMTMRMDIGGHVVELAGEGEFTTAPERARLVFTGSLLPRPLEMVADGATLYYRADAPPYDALAQGKPWVSLDASGFRSPLDPTRSDPLQALRALEADGALRDTREAGTATVGGVRTACYRADVDVARLAAAAMSPQMDQLSGLFRDMTADMAVCAGDDGLLRRSTLRMEAMTAGQPVTVTATSEFFDHGASVDIAVPSPDQVTPVSVPSPPSG